MLESESERGLQIAPGTILRETYEIVEYRGSGAFGWVFRVQHRFLGTQALKVLKPLDQTRQAGWQAEARLLATIVNPHVVRVFDAFLIEQGNRQYPAIAMEYIGQGTLDELRYRSLRLPVETTAAIGCQIAEALTVLHERDEPIIHRDLTPANVLIANTEPVNVKVGDFGLATMVPHSLGFTSTAGTIRYMAPEAAFGFQQPSSDLFSLGLILYETVTGVPPFPVPSRRDTDTSSAIQTYLARTWAPPPPPPKQFLPAIPSDFNDLMLELLDLDPRRRIRSARTVQDRLRQIEAKY